MSDTTELHDQQDTDRDSQSSDPRNPGNIRRAAMLTASLGIAHAILLMSATLLITARVPGVTASDAAIEQFYRDPSERRAVVIAGLYLVPFAGIAFIWFFVALRMWVSGTSRRENILLSNVQLVSGIIYITLVFTAGASLSVVALSMEFSEAPFDPLYARAFSQYGVSLVLVMSMRMAAMFVLTTANIGRFAKILPTWFVVASYPVALGLLLSASVNPLLILVFPAWVLTFSVLLLDRARKAPLDARLGDRIGQRVLEAGGS